MKFLRFQLFLTSCLALTLASKTPEMKGVLECEFRYEDLSEPGKLYTCIVKNVFQFGNKVANIESISGQHIPGKCNADVESLAFRNGSMKFFPKNIGKFFNKLKVLSVENMGLERIQKEDLETFPNLVFLYLYNNKIAKIENNLLGGNRKLQYVSFHSNPIKTIFPNAFNHLNLTHLDLTNQNCLNLTNVKGLDQNTASQIVEQINSGACLEQGYNIEIIKVFDQMQIDEETLKKVIQTYLNCENEKQKQQQTIFQLKEEMNALNGEILQYKTKLEGSERENKKLKRKLNLSKTDLNECEESLDKFQKNLDDYIQKMNNTPTTELTNLSESEIFSLLHLKNLLQIKVEYQQHIIQTCENRAENCQNEECPDVTCSDASETERELREEIKKWKINYNNTLGESENCNKQRYSLKIDLEKCKANPTSPDCPNKPIPSTCQENLKLCTDNLVVCDHEKQKLKDVKKTCETENQNLREDNNQITLNINAVKLMLEQCELQNKKLIASCGLTSCKNDTSSSSNTTALRICNIELEELTSNFKKCEEKLQNGNLFIKTLGVLIDRYDNNVNSYLVDPYSKMREGICLNYTSTTTQHYLGNNVIH